MLTLSIDILESKYSYWWKNPSGPSRPLFTGNLISSRPLIDRVVNLKVSLDLVTSVRLATNAQTGAVTVIVGKCSSDEDSISLTVLDR